MSSHPANLTFATLSPDEQYRMLNFYYATRSFKTKLFKRKLKTAFSTTNAPQHNIDLMHVDSFLNTNPFLIDHLDLHQRQVLHDNLILIYYKLCLQYQYLDNEHRRQQLKKHYQKIEQCKSLIGLVVAAENDRALRLKERSLSEERFNFEQWLTSKTKAILEHANDISAGKTVYLRQWMSDLNVWRLYWVWAGSLLSQSLNLIKNNFYHIQRTKDFTQAPQQGLGYVSWVLYYVRFLINFTLLLKHTIRGPWMSKAERARPWKTRLQQQWQLRKFGLINDLIWASTNMVCFFWLAGQGLLGNLGNLLTIGLLVVDSILTQLKTAESIKEHRDNLNRFNSEINSIEIKKKEIPELKLLSDEQQSRINELDEQLKQLIAAKETCLFEWKHKARGFIADIIYGLGLLIGFSTISCGSLLKGLVSTTLTSTISMTGAGLCFVFSLTYAIYKASMEISKTKELRQTTLEQCANILSKQIPLSTQDYLRYQDLKATAAYQQQMVEYHRNVLIRKAMVEALIPFAVFTAFTFLSFGLAAAILAFGMIITIASHFIIEHRKPKQPPASVFNRNEYDQFIKKQPTTADSKTITLNLGRLHRLFDKTQNKQEPGPLLDATSPSPNG